LNKKGLVRAWNLKPVVLSFAHVEVQIIQCLSRLHYCELLLSFFAAIGK